jgi:hypothetical protein
MGQSSIKQPEVSEVKEEEAFNMRRKRRRRERSPTYEAISKRKKRKKNKKNKKKKEKNKRKERSALLGGTRRRGCSFCFSFFFPPHIITFFVFPFFCIQSLQQSLAPLRPTSQLLLISFLFFLPIRFSDIERISFFPFLLSPQIEANQSFAVEDIDIDIPPHSYL